MIVEIENYQIRPYPNNLCWEIWKFRGVKKKDGSVSEEWVSEGRYPSDLAQALATVHERLLKEGGSVAGIEDAIKAVEAQARAIVKAADKAAKDVGRR